MPRRHFAGVYCGKCELSLSSRAESTDLREAISFHLRQYYLDFGYYPTSEQGLDFFLASEIN